MKRVLVLVALGAFALGACGNDDGGQVRSIGDASGSASGSASAPASGSGVAAECVPVGNADAATTTVDVGLSEFTIDVAQEPVPAGTVHFALANTGADPHEFVVLRGVAPADLPIAGDGSFDESSLPDGALVGEVEPFPAGETCDGTFELAPGEYTLVCNIVEEENGGTESHLQEGMVTTLTVT